MKKVKRGRYDSKIQKYRIVGRSLCPTAGVDSNRRPERYRQKHHRQAPLLNYYNL